MTNNNDTPVICALATPSHLHLAVAMADSFILHHLHGKVFVLQIGGEKLSFPSRKYLSILTLEDLNAESEIDSMRERYTIFEFCNALKPYLLKHLLENTVYPKICYFDSDLYILGNMEKAVWEKFDDCSVMLTPHYVKIVKDDELTYRQELATIIRGVYNAGFVGVRKGENSLQFVNWWKGKVFRGCYKRPEEGIFVDQRWLDIVPGFDIGVKINCHPGLNVAYWNFRERKISLDGDNYLVNGEPLMFFHISSFSPEKPDIVTKVNTELRASNFPHLPDIFNEYAEKLTSVKLELEQRLMKQTLPETFLEEFRAKESETLVSVIIETHNDETHIGQSIESVLQQSLSAEIIVIDGGSTDNTREIVKSYGEKAVLIEEANAARNLVIKQAKGEFIIFLESGNYILFPNILEGQSSAFRNETCAAVIGGWREIKENDGKSSEHLSWLNYPALNLKNLLKIPFIKTSAVMFRRSALLEISGFNAEFQPAEILDALLRLTNKGYSAEWLKRVTVACRNHEEKLSRTLELRAEALKKMRRNFFQDENLSPDIKRLEETIHFDSLVWLANRFYHAGNFEAMKKVLLESLNHTKLSVRGALVYWFSKFSRISSEERRRFDAFDLTNTLEWQELESLEFGKIRKIETVSETRRNNFVLPKQFEKTDNENALAETANLKIQAEYAPKINLTQTLTRFVGKHRAGWNYALQSLLPLHTADGIYFDGGSDATFDTENPNLQTNLTNGWVGLFHNPPNMPEWFAPTRTQKLILASENFQKSLENCYGIFCLSNSHGDWLAKQIDVPVVALLHPTETPKVKFSLENFLANSEKRIIQIGHWIRKLHSIYYLPTFLKRCAVYQNFDFVEKFFETEKEIYDFCVCDSEVEILPFLSESEYDELLAENIAYIELYDASANNAVIECIVRNTPILVNPLPAVREYLGDDYPFYFNSRMEAAAKAEDFALIAETHEYLKNLDVKKKLTAEFFLKSFAESEIYRKLP